MEDENNRTEETETSDNDYLSDFTKLQPYLYWPCVSKEAIKENCSGKESSDSEEDFGRIGNALWCSCGKNKPMSTHGESICCLDKYEIRGRCFKGMLSFVFETFASKYLLVRKRYKLDFARFLFTLNNF